MAAQPGAAPAAMPRSRADESARETQQPHAVPASGTARSAVQPGDNEASARLPVELGGMQRPKQSTSTPAKSRQGVAADSESDFAAVATGVSRLYPFGASTVAVGCQICYALSA